MNRAVGLRIAACVLMGLGAALLIASLLLTTYTSSRIAKVPLDIDTTLVSNGTGTALDPASLLGDKFVVNKNVPLAMQRQISVESPANADVVTLQAGTTVRRTDKQQENGLLLAIIDTVTMNRRTAMAVSVGHQPRRFGAKASHHGRPGRADAHSVATPGADLPLPVRYREEDLPVL